MRNYETNPITAPEAITLFKDESSDLALASEATVLEAADLAEREGMFHISSDIHSRWNDYQEELRYMMAELMREFA